MVGWPGWPTTQQLPNVFMDVECFLSLEIITERAQVGRRDADRRFF